MRSFGNAFTGKEYMIVHMYGRSTYLVTLDIFSAARESTSLRHSINYLEVVEDQLPVELLQ